VDLLALDQALRDLERLSPRQARVVELLFFGGLSIDEVAQQLDVSRSLIDKELRRARAWIRRRLEAP
jgi:RNA polymerase sigma-70 factor (ECF subfamily)